MPQLAINFKQLTNIQVKKNVVHPAHSISRCFQLGLRLLEKAREH